MQAIENKLVELLENSSDVSIASLGGIDFVMKSWECIANSKLADDFLRALTKDKSIVFPEGCGLIELYCKTLVENKDSLVIKNVALLICSNAEQLKGCFDIIMEQLDTKLDSFAKGQLLLGSFAISVLDKSKRYRLISFLLKERNLKEESEFAPYLIKITGLGYSYFANEDLLTLLEELNISLPGNEDSNFELGMAYLKKALDAIAEPSVLKHIQSSLAYFVAAEKIGSAAAACFKHILKILVEFSSTNEKPDLPSAIVKLRIDIAAYSGFHTYSDKIRWATLRQRELMDWYRLCSKLERLNAELSEIGWLNPILIIEEFLLQIYDAQRAILMYDSDGGLDLILRPAVVKRMSPLAEKISLLEQWLGAFKPDITKSLAGQLLGEIETFKSSSITGNVVGTAFKGFDDAVPSFKNIPVEIRNAFQEFMSERLSQDVIRKDKIVEKLFCMLIDEFEKNGFSDDSDIWMAFREIVYYSLMFLKQRMDGTVKNFPRSKYLFSGDNVLENALQDDYFQYMHPLILNCNVDVEQDDVAGGRADVFFRFLDFAIVAEVKREKKSLSVVELAHEYMAQTKEYQNTSAKLGMLVVLDLSEKKNGIGSIESNVKAFTIETDDNGGKRGVVLFRIAGNRVTPSKM